MCDMLRLAHADIEGANFFMNRGDDEVYLNYAGYHLSQAAEKLVKLHILESGQIPPKVHSIRQLFNFMKNQSIYDTMFDNLLSASSEIDEWTSTTRYVVHVLACRERLNYALEVITGIYNQLNITAKEEPNLKNNK